VDGNINFKLGGNYRRGGRRVWYTFQVLDFQKFEILTVGPLYAASVRHHAKFHQNRSNGCRDTTI